MRSRLGVALVVLFSLHVPLSLATAGVRPYVRAAFGGNHLAMPEVNDDILHDQNVIRDVGVPVEFQKVGSSFGPTAAAGLWLFPAFRIGATYSHQHAFRENRVHEPGLLYYDDQMDFWMTEVGAEAAFRVVRLAGLCIGGEIAQGRAKFVEGYSVEDGFGQYYMDGSARRTMTTYGAFVGLDQTNAAGIAGFVRAGYRWRDMGSMPGEGTVSDGTNSAPFTSSTVGMDYSGFYLMAGMGFDLGH